MTYTPSCIACARLLTSTDDPTGFSDIPMPNEATLFTSDGNYGSTVWDPQSKGGLQLLIWVCDVCMIVNGQEGVVLLMQSIRRPSIINLAKWRAHEDAEPLGEV